jgi:hypothetical protein
MVRTERFQQFSTSGLLCLSRLEANLGSIPKSSIEKIVDTESTSPGLDAEAAICPKTIPYQRE